MPRGHTVNKECYLKVKKHLREAVRRKRLDSWSEKNVYFTVIISLLIRDFSANHEITPVQQLPYSPDLAPVDFVLFLKLKLTLSVRCFGSFENIKKKSLSELRAIPQKNI
jgi:hypothetical protein